MCGHPGGRGRNQVERRATAVGSAQPAVVGMGLTSSGRRGAAQATALTGPRRWPQSHPGDPHAIPRRTWSAARTIMPPSASTLPSCECVEPWSVGLSHGGAQGLLERPGIQRRVDRALAHRRGPRDRGNSRRSPARGVHARHRLGTPRTSGRQGDSVLARAAEHVDQAAEAHIRSRARVGSWRRRAARIVAIDRAYPGEAVAEPPSPPVAERRRAVAWVKADPLGVEFAEIAVVEDQLMAVGVAVGTAPVPYRLDYELDTGSKFVTTRLAVTSRGDGGRREHDLRRDAEGV